MNELVIIALLIILNGLLAMSEIALISARKSNLSTQAKHGSKSAKLALKLANEPDKFLSTVQIGITVIGILTGIFSGSVLADNFSTILISWGIPSSYAHLLVQSIIIILVTYFTLIFGELVPKRIGMSVAEKTSKIVAQPMYILSRVTSPFVWILAKSTGFIFNLMGFRSDISSVTEAEIKSMIEEGAKDGTVQEVEQDIVGRVFLLGDLKVNSLMTHRSEMVALDVNMTNHEIKKQIQVEMFEVYPVIDRDFDNVEGIVQLKDIIFKLDDPEFKLIELLKPAVYFHESQSVYKALEQMKGQRISQALICDEFGSCQGIITLKDILEGLVGTLEDTHDEPNIIKRQDHEGWLVDGQCPLYDFFTYFDREDLYAPDNQFTTIGGLILKILGRIPRSGEKAVWHDFELEIVDMDGARIDKILVTTSNNPT